MTQRKLLLRVIIPAVALAGAMAILLAPAVMSSDNAMTIVIDRSVRHQTMRGWEATIDLPDSGEKKRYLKIKDEIFDKAAGDLGINRVRLEIRAGAESKSRAWDRYAAGQLTYKQWAPLRYETINDNDDPNVIDAAGFDFSELDQMIEQQVLPMRKRLADRGQKLFVNLCYVAFTKQAPQGEYIHDDPEEYAELILATSLHIREKYDFEPDSWEAILEPDLVPEWTPRYTGEAILAAARRLEQNGFAPRFIAPSVTNTANAPRYIDAIARVKGAMDYVSEFSYHRYRNATSANVRAIARRGEKFGKPTSMLELWFGRATSRILFEDLTIGNVSSFQGRTLFGHFDVIKNETDGLDVELREEVAENRQVFRHVGMNAVRIGASADKASAAIPVAFENPDGSIAVAILTPAPMSIRLTGLPPGRYEVSYAAGKQTTVEPAKLTVSRNGVADVLMPFAGVIAIASEAATKSSGHPQKNP